MFKIVPKEQRDKYRMVFKSRMGCEDQRRISNSDMIYFDHYSYQLRDELYSQSVWEAFLQKKRNKASFRRFADNQCHLCGEITEESEDFFRKYLPWRSSANQDTKTDSLKYCYFCMDTQTCNNCMSEELVYIPRDVNLMEDPKKHRVCKHAFKLLQ